MKKARSILLIFFIAFMFNGCIGLLTAASSAVTLLMTTQEVDEEYDGDISEYVSDKVDSTYDYLTDSAAED